MLDPSAQDESSVTEETLITYRLPPVHNLDDVNTNFETVSEAFTVLIREMKNHSEVTNQNLTNLAMETNKSLQLFANNLKAVISAQNMALVVLVIVIGSLLLAGRALIEVFYI